MLFKKSDRMWSEPSPMSDGAIDLDPFRRSGWKLNALETSISSIPKIAFHAVKEIGPIRSLHVTMLSAFSQGPRIEDFRFGNFDCSSQHGQQLMLPLHNLLTGLQCT